MTEIQSVFFIGSIVTSLVFIALNTYTVSLLFPLAKGIIESNFDHVKKELILRHIIDFSPSLFDNTTRIFILLVLWLYFVIFTKNIFQYLSNISTDSYAKKSISKLRTLIVDRLFILNKSFFDSSTFERIHSTIVRSSNIIEKQFVLFRNLIVQTALMFVFLGIMFYISGPLTLLVIFLFPAIDFFIRKIIKKTRQLQKETNESEDSFVSLVSNLVNNILLVKIFAKENQEKVKFEDSNKFHINKKYEVKRISNLVTAIQDVGSTTMMLVLAFGIALLISRFGLVDPTKMFVFLFLAQKLAPILGTFHSFLLGIEESKKSIDEINDILINSEKKILKNGSVEFLKLEKGIVFNNLDFYYEGEQGPTLSKLNLSIPRGRVTALVGPTGSGKSTILNLLLRFYDASGGDLLVDGMDIRHYDYNSLRKKIAYVNQDSLFFKDTIYNNLIYGKQGDVDGEFLNQIMKKTKYSGFVEKLPNKLNTVIQEKAVNLSGGQKQRTSIIRALLSDYEILVLDEATSSLDPQIENAIFETIKEIACDKTVIVVSHKMSLVKKADNIIFLREGQMIESGTFDELMERKSEFYKHWQV